MSNRVYFYRLEQDLEVQQRAVGGNGFNLKYARACIMFAKFQKLFWPSWRFPGAIVDLKAPSYGSQCRFCVTIESRSRSVWEVVILKFASQTDCLDKVSYEFLWAEIEGHLVSTFEPLSCLWSSGRSYCRLKLN